MITTEAFMDIISLHRQGFSMRAIAKKLGIHRRTVKKHIEDNAFPQYQTARRQESILDPFRQTIDDYLATDDYQATWIFDGLAKSPKTDISSNFDLVISVSYDVDFFRF